MSVKGKCKIVVFLSFIFFDLKASQPIVLEDKNNQKEYYFAGQTIDIFEDKTRNIKIEQIIAPGFDKNFKDNKLDISRNVNLSSAYWVKFTVINKSTRNKGWLIELYDFRIDSFDIYIPDGKGNFIHESGGDAYLFSNKKYLHKNFVYDLPLDLHQKNKPEVFYIRIYSSSPVGLIGVIRTINRFSHYALMEYYLLALFYGIIFSMALYNLFLFISVRDPAYLFYVLYLISFGVYAVCQDGTGFQFLWPKHPELNGGVGQIALLSLIVWLLLYAKYFLLTKENSPFFDRIFKILIAVRIILFLIGFLFSTTILYRFIPNYDTFCVMVAFLAGIQCYRNGYTPARYYNIAFVLFLAGYVISTIDSLWLNGSSIIIFYSLNIGAAGEMLLLSLALGDRIKSLIKDKQLAQNEIIIQLMEKEQLKDRINKELEQKVDERTRELQEKNKQLDTFVYRASHDIKGPLKSVIGLTQVGMKDSNDEIAHEYFSHILKSTNRLDKLLSELLLMTKVQQAEVNKTSINFKELVDEILVSFHNFEGYEKVKFETEITGINHFLSDRSLLYSVIQNMIENGIKYRDEKKQQSYLNIKIHNTGTKVKMEFSDNGVGIHQEMHEKIFEMFFKANDNTHGTGLGLHIVKIALEKLQGEISVKSTHHDGSIFTIEL